MLLVTSSLRLLGWLALSPVALVAACGGNVVVDHGSGGGGGSSTGTVTSTGGTTTTASGTTTTGTTTWTETTTTTTGTATWTETTTTTPTEDPPSCEALESELVATLEAATACNACTAHDGCIEGPTLNDLCGCPIAANSSSGQAAEQAQVAYEAWTGAGCGPHDCEPPCPPSGSPRFCMPMNGCGGVCRGAH